MAIDFSADMSLSASGIRGMLEEYESDCCTGMDTEAIAGTIYEYTSSYPYLVSRICEHMDLEGRRKRSNSAWTSLGVEKAVGEILAENNPLFDAMAEDLNHNPEGRALLRWILTEGADLSWNPDQMALTRLQELGLIREEKGRVRIANRIFASPLFGGEQNAATFALCK